MESRRESIDNTLFFYAAMVLNIFLGWIIARLNTDYLEVPVYGQLAFFTTIILFGRTLFDFGFFEASSRLMAIEKDKAVRSRLLGASFLWAIFFALLSVVILYLLGEFIDSIFEVKVGFLCQKFAYGLGLYVLLAYVSRIMRGLGHIKILALLSIAPRIIYSLLLILIIFVAEFTLTSTLEMMFWGILLTLLAAWIYLKPSLKYLAEQSKRIKTEVKAYGRHIYVSIIWGELLIHADKFLVSYFLDSQSLAFYALAFTLAIPLSLFSTSLATSLFNKFASVEFISPKIIRANFIFVISSVIIFLLIRKHLIYYLFSEQYEPAIELLLPLGIAFGLSGLSRPFTMFLMANRHGKIVRNISVLIPTIKIGLSILIIPIYGVYGVAWVTTIVYGLDLILFVFSYLRITKIPFSQLL